MSKNSVFDLGDLSKPATVLVEKIADALEGVAKPHQIVRVAKAQAKADLIKAETDLEIEELQRRAMKRFVLEEARKQANIEQITERALPLLDSAAAPENVQADWFVNFFERCRTISDADLQGLWSKILAGEANRPGRFSRKTVNLMSDLDKSDADLFAALCGFGWNIFDEFVPLVLDCSAPIYLANGINFESLTQLDNVGLIRFEGLGVSKFQLPNAVQATYQGKSVQLKFREGAPGTLSIGSALLTKAGAQLATVCNASAIPGFFDYVCARWVGLGILQGDGQ